MPCPGVLWPGCSSWRVWCVAVLATCWLHGLTVAAAQDAELVVAENDHLRIALDPRDGSLRDLVDRSAGHNHIDPVDQDGSLWEIELLVGDRPVVLKATHAASFRCESLSAPRIGLHATWDSFALPQAANCRVQVTVELDPDAPMSRWSIALDKPPELSVRHMQFPRIVSIRRQAAEYLAAPVWLGQLATDPCAQLCVTGGNARRHTWHYPGQLSLQCLAYYRDGASGLYAACDDTAATRKGFTVWGTPLGQLGLELIHYPPAFGLHADRCAPSYQVLLGTFQGDWITATERYRAWALQQPWAESSRLRRGLVPDWLLDTGLWVWNRGRSPGVLGPAATLQQCAELPVSVFWHWWHGCPYDIGFPEYLPPREGTEPFKQALAQAHGQGLHAIVYMNQRAWGMSTRSWQDEGAERYAVKGEDGKVQPEVYNIFTRQALASMCLATPFWRDKYAALADEVLNELRVDGIYMDQACSHRACFDSDHPHPLGGGDSWMKGFQQLTQDIRRRVGSDRPIVLAGEGCGEAWLEHLDLMLTLQVSRERYASPTDRWEVIPMFQAVYHPYAVTYGTYSSLTMPPYDDLWPAEFAPAQPLTTLDRKYSRQFYLEQARAFVWGQQPAVANFLPRLLQERPTEIEYLIRLAQVRQRARKYLLYGTFLRPPDLGAPEVTSDFSRLSIYAGQQSRLTSFTRRHPLAIAGAWQAEDGDVAVVLASVADQPLPLAITLDKQYYGIRPGSHVWRIDQSGRQPLDVAGGDLSQLQITLPPRAAWIIEFSSRGSSADGPGAELREQHTSSR